MSNTPLEVESNAEWAELETRIGPYEPYEVTNGESNNEQVAYVLNHGYVVIEGPPRAWIDFAHDILDRWATS